MNTTRTWRCTERFQGCMITRSGLALMRFTVKLESRSDKHTEIQVGTFHVGTHTVNIINNAKSQNTFLA